MTGVGKKLKKGIYWRNILELTTTRLFSLRFYGLARRYKLMIERLKITVLTILLFNCLALIGCNKSKLAIASKPQEVPATDLNVGTRPSATPASATTPDTPIRRFDFRNFTYYEPNYGYLGKKKGIGYLGRSQAKYKLTNGEEPEIRDKNEILKNSPASFVSVDYEDLTGDNVEDALIVLSILTGGSAMANNLYVYTWDKNHPREIISFSAGDRADGGFRRMYAENGELIIELNAGDEKSPECDGCQSTRFLRLRYKWNGHKFIKVKQEILPIK